jgi:hypothetical protein
MNQPDFIIQFLLAALAVWRVTHLLAFEDGPGDLIVKLRALLGDSFAGRLMDCFLCLSLWIAAPAALLVTRTPLEWMLVGLALSGAACLLERLGRQAAEAQPQLAQPNPQPISLQQNQSALMQQFLEGEKHHVLWPETIRTAEYQLSPDDREYGAPSQPGFRSEAHANGLYRA